MPRFPIAGSADADVEAIRGRAVLVTGATGFIGKHLIQALVAAGAVVHGVARVLPARDRAHDGVVWHPGDVTDPLPLQEAVARAAPACVFHLAAYGTTPLQRDAGRMRATRASG